MGIRLTNDKTVAMYDSVSGFAFGPTFDNEDEAEDFIAFVEEEYQIDPRRLTDLELEQARKKFNESN